MSAVQPSNTGPASTNLSPDTNAVAALEEVQETEQITRQENEVITRDQLQEPSAARIAQSFNERPFNLDDRDGDNLPQETGAKAGRLETVLYLAYGSNLAAKTFQGARHIRPLAAINVIVPELVLCFDLPGIPYTEPCFANSNYRNTSLADTSEATRSTEQTSLLHGDKSSSEGNGDYTNPEWPHGMVGVVYEVTLQDYARIIATEGGGSTYKDILVSCYTLPSGISRVPSEPSSKTPALKAHSLYSPASGSRIHRPRPDYAQASARYLKLLTDGAAEHELPDDYQKYLHSLQPYRTTTRRQRAGQWLFTTVWRPVVMAMFQLGRRTADDKGKLPKWVALIYDTVFRAIWLNYDYVYYWVFGDGERTQKGNENVMKTPQ